jgi:hypothetical protein
MSYQTITFDDTFKVYGASLNLILIRCNKETIVQSPVSGTHKPMPSLWNLRSLTPLEELTGRESPLRHCDQTTTSDQIRHTSDDDCQSQW